MAQTYTMHGLPATSGTQNPPSGAQLSPPTAHAITADHPLPTSGVLWPTYLRTSP